MISLTSPVLSFSISDGSLWDNSLIYYARNYNPVQVLRGARQGDDHYSRYDLVMAIGAQAAYTLPSANSESSGFKRLKELYGLSNNGWVFTHLNYDLKNEVEYLKSESRSTVKFPDLYAFIPHCVITRKENQVEIYGDLALAQEIQNKISLSKPRSADPRPVTLDVPDKEAYLNKVKQVKQYIHDGRIYEMNLCVEFKTNQKLDSPERTFSRLQEYAEAPFAVFYKLWNNYLLCASPERYFQSAGNIVRSQPIKGTARKVDDTMDEKLQLATSEKDRAEHVMIVDLVRNDIKRNSRSGTVRVEELMGIHSFKHVHHMISTIEGTLLPDRDTFDALRDCFPMGSMTGAPKIEAMKVIEELEDFRRGLYSGAIGYINPEGDMDFNVVIRSILYNRKTAEISCPVGGAIVQDSIPEQEWEECLLKLNNVQRILSLESLDY